MGNSSIEALLFALLMFSTVPIHAGKFSGFLALSPSKRSITTIQDKLNGQQRMTYNEPIISPLPTGKQKRSVPNNSESNSEVGGYRRTYVRYDHQSRNAGYIGHPNAHFLSTITRHTRQLPYTASTLPFQRQFHRSETGTTSSGTILGHQHPIHYGGGYGLGSNDAVSHDTPTPHGEHPYFHNPWATYFGPINAHYLPAAIHSAGMAPEQTDANSGTHPLVHNSQGDINGHLPEVSSSPAANQGGSSSHSKIKYENRKATANASAHGNFGGSQGQTQVQGGASHDGTFQAQAQSGFEFGAVHSQVQGQDKRTSSLSSSQVDGIVQSQTRVQLGYEDDSEVQASAQGTSPGGNRFKSTVQGQGQTGQASSQATGPGQTSSMAQVGLKDVNETSSSPNAQHEREISATAQGGYLRGQSQTQYRGNGPFRASAQSSFGDGDEPLNGQPSSTVPMAIVRPDGTSNIVPVVQGPIGIQPTFGRPLYDEVSQDVGTSHIGAQPPPQPYPPTHLNPHPYAGYYNPSASELSPVPFYYPVQSRSPLSMSLRSPPTPNPVRSHNELSYRPPERRNLRLTERHPIQNEVLATTTSPLPSSTETPNVLQVRTPQRTQFPSPRPPQESLHRSPHFYEHGILNNIPDRRQSEMEGELAHQQNGLTAAPDPTPNLQFPSATPSPLAKNQWAPARFTPFSFPDNTDLVTDTPNHTDAPLPSMPSGLQRQEHPTPAKLIDKGRSTQTTDAPEVKALKDHHATKIGSNSAEPNLTDLAASQQKYPAYNGDPGATDYVRRLKEGLSGLQKSTLGNGFSRSGFPHAATSVASSFSPSPSPPIRVPRQQVQRKQCQGDSTVVCTVVYHRHQPFRVCRMEPTACSNRS